MTQKISQRTKARVRQQALRAMCNGPDGKMHANAKAVFAYLRTYCNGDGKHGLPLIPATGQVDSVALARMAGRREVFDLLCRLAAVTIEDRHTTEDL